ncbi:MAG: hypothetical protein E7261_11560 [Lachnospiraceae bacterium]|nr:hypothetical protein [Lachnospiraceae bacterium]
MMILLEIKEYLKLFYAKFDIYIISVAKFLVTLVALNMVNSDLGYMSKLTGTPIVLLVSLVCAVLPWGISAVAMAMFIVGHFYEVSLELAGVALVILLIMFCLYIRFGNGDSIYIVLTFILFGMNIPYVMPVVVGLASGMVTAVPVAFGIILFYLVQFVNGNATALTSTGTDDMLAKFKFIIDSILNNRQMFLLIIAFTLTIILVYIIRKLAIDFAWLVAVGVGAIVDAMILLIGEFMLDISITAGGVILGTFMAIVIGIILQFFLFAVDYRRAEKVKFEDDDYVYFVKAVPKINVKLSKKKVKRSSTGKSKTPVRQNKPVKQGLQIKQMPTLKKSIPTKQNQPVKPIQKLEQSTVDNSAQSEKPAQKDAKQ